MSVCGAQQITETEAVPSIWQSNVTVFGRNRWRLPGNRQVVKSMCFPEAQLQVFWLETPQALKCGDMERFFYYYFFFKVEEEKETKPILNLSLCWITEMPLSSTHTGCRSKIPNEGCAWVGPHDCGMLPHSDAPYSEVAGMRRE